MEKEKAEEKEKEKEKEKKDLRSKFFHHQSVSVPISISMTPGDVVHHSIPFGPPIIHEEPEKTLFQAPPNPLLLMKTESMQDYFFNPAARTIHSFDDDDDGGDGEKMDLQ